MVWKTRGDWQITVFSFSTRRRWKKNNNNNNNNNEKYCVQHDMFNVVRVRQKRSIIIIIIIIIIKMVHVWRRCAVEKE